MGTGFGIYCERCGTQISYDMRDYTLKGDGDKYDLCGLCAKIIAFEKRLKEDDKKEN